MGGQKITTTSTSAATTASATKYRGGILTASVDLGRISSGAGPGAGAGGGAGVGLGVGGMPPTVLAQKNPVLKYGYDDVTSPPVTYGAGVGTSRRK